MSGGAAFSRAGALALVLGGLGLLFAALYLIGAGEEFGGGNDRGQAHASAKGLNGYAGLVQLVENAGYDIERSRRLDGLKTNGLLVLTPPLFADAEEVGEILKDRAFRGPTLVILSKWWAQRPSQNLPPAQRDRFKRGWVMLDQPTSSSWTNDLAAPYKLRHRVSRKPGEARARWSGLGFSGTLPTGHATYAEPFGLPEVLARDGEGRALALRYPATGQESAAEEYPVVFLVEPDLANNYGLADPTRAAAAMALIETLTEGGDINDVTFDMTLNGFGASENLLTLAFRPPFLAATLSLLLALLIVGWRAFRRFGPPAAAAGPDIAFGKRQLIANGAGLIVRARRFALLGAPYAALSARRLADRLGLARPDPQAIDAALARRLPREEPYTRRAARIETAATPADLVAAAQSLDDLAAKLSEPSSSGTKTR